jgi:hypothetical protein
MNGSTHRPAVSPFRSKRASTTLLSGGGRAGLGRAKRRPKVRPYQSEANDAIERALADRKSQMLIAMATGTGNGNSVSFTANTWNFRDTTSSWNWRRSKLTPPA